MLENTLKWDAYSAGKVLDEATLKTLTDYRDPEGREYLENNDPGAVAAMITAVAEKVESPGPVEYVLTIGVDFLSTEPTRVSLFHQLATSPSRDPYAPFLRIVKRNMSWYTTCKATAMLTFLLSKDPLSSDIPAPLEVRLTALRTYRDLVLASNSNSHPDQELAAGLAGLQTLLQDDSLRVAFWKESGASRLVSILEIALRRNVQILYQAVFLVWVLGYNKSISKDFSRTPILTMLLDILRAHAKEKVVRITLAALVNALDQGTNNESLLEAGLPALLSNLALRKWSDEDMIADMERLTEVMDANMHVMSSIEKYRVELASGRLAWGTCHTSERFWREHAHVFHAQDCKLLRALVACLNSEDTVTVAVACHDLGEFARFYPRGKALLQELNAKAVVMKLMSHREVAVQKNALLAVQKMMVNNWEHLRTVKI